MEPNDSRLVVTESDVANLNRRTVERSASIARTAGTLLVVIGAVGIAGWAWFAVRTQDRGGMVQYGLAEDFDMPGPSDAERIDLFASSLSLLMFSAVVVGVGLLLRFAADYGQTRVGGSVTGFQVGDRFDDEDTP